MSKDFWKNLNVHKSFVADKARNEAYFNALKELSVKYSTAVDIGSGTGVLSFLAAKAGFKKVTGIEQTDLVELARKTCEANSLQNAVSFIEGDLFETSLNEKVDLIIHDQIGDFVWNEDIVRKIEHAKRNFLKTGGAILPYKIEVYFVPVSHPASLIDLTVWENDVHGLNFSDLKKAELAQVEANLKPQKIFLKNDSCFLAEPQLACSIDLTGQPKDQVSVSLQFKLKSDGICTAVLGFMKIYFTETISLSTAPSEAVTNWGQFSLQNIKQKLRRRDEVLKFSLNASPESKNWQWQIN